jgi:hypothetical protein
LIYLLLTLSKPSLDVLEAPNPTMF